MVWIDTQPYSSEEVNFGNGDLKVYTSSSGGNVMVSCSVGNHDYAPLTPPDEDGFRAEGHNADAFARSFCGSGEDGSGGSVVRLGIDPHHLVISSLL